MSYTLKDGHFMPFGEHKDLKMRDVPASYLLKMYDKLPDGTVKHYIKFNLESLKVRAENEQRTKSNN